MGDTIIKPAPDDDFYVVFSSIVDAPTIWGSRSLLERDYKHAAADRFERADACGSSAQWGSPLAYSWADDDTLLLRNGFDAADWPEEASYATVARSDLREFCESAGSDGYFHPRPGLVAWHDADPSEPPEGAES